MNFASVELAVMVEAHSGQRGDESSDGFEFCIAEDRGSALFIVIFEETRAVALRGHGSGEARANVGNVAAAERVVQSLVIRELKTELLHARFAVPVDFSEPDEFARKSSDGFGPEFFGGRRAAGEERRPGAGENVV